ncbi:MAG: phosphoglucomutase/phosphomannomutase family protein [Bacteroidota bacterium]
MSAGIRFGTDGWRAVIADDFTFANLRLVARATARFFRRHPRREGGIVIGYDARFMSREFAETAAAAIADEGIGVKLADSIVTTPMISLLTKLERAAGGVVITASHNPARYNGFKIKGDFGGPAHPEMIARVERELASVLRAGPRRREPSFAALAEAGRIRPINMRRRYLSHLGRKIDIPLIRRSGIRILYDAMYGAGQGVLGEILPRSVQMRGEFNPSFGGMNPEPMAHNLTELARRVRREKFDLGIATDGDADRIGAVDEKGVFVDSHRIFALLLKYLVEEKGMRGEVVKTFSVTQMVDAQCRAYGLRLTETPIGFKHVCRLMTERDVLIGGEESGGLGVKGHIPERDGIYLGLLLAEMMAVRGKTLGALVRELMEEFGVHEFGRADLHLGGAQKEAFMKRYRGAVRRIGPFPVRGRKDTDGHKFFVDGGWVLVRASGTEPLVRVYAEADGRRKADALLRAAAAV